MLNRRYITTAAVLFLIANAIFPWYIVAPISGRIVDSESGQPIANAVVASYFEIKSFWFSGRSGALVPRETKTDAQGRFTLGGWDFLYLDRFNARIHSSSPRVLVLKEGYRPYVTGGRGVLRRFILFFSGVLYSGLNGSDQALNKIKVDSRSISIDVETLDIMYSRIGANSERLCLPYLREEINAYMRYPRSIGLGGSLTNPAMLDFDGCDYEAWVD